MGKRLHAHCSEVSPGTVGGIAQEPFNSWYLLNPEQGIPPLPSQPLPAFPLFFFYYLLRAMEGSA